MPPVDDGEGVKILKGGHNLGGVEEGGGVRELSRAEQDHQDHQEEGGGVGELPRAEQHHEGSTSKWQREQGFDV